MSDVAGVRPHKVDYPPTGFDRVRISQIIGSFENAPCRMIKGSCTQTS
jgi:hypothetical protein